MFGRMDSAAGPIHSVFVAQIGSELPRFPHWSNSEEDKQLSKRFLLSKQQRLATPAFQV